MRYGRTVLAPARWRLDAAALPARTAGWERWDAALAGWAPAAAQCRAAKVNQGLQGELDRVHGERGRGDHRELPPAQRVRDRAPRNHW
jgi:hypothetical protein